MSFSLSNFFYQNRMIFTEVYSVSQKNPPLRGPDIFHFFHKRLRIYNHFYRAMHFSAKRGIVIACRLSVRPSVCNVGRLCSHRLELFEINFTVS